jgi:pimeloyl-ACP methyl ester carboxylesterase
VKTPAAHPFRSPQAKAEYEALYIARAKGWPVASETRLIESFSGQTFVRISGQPTNPPLVLLPGSKGTSLTWIPNIAALSAHYRTYALDSIYDFGLSVARRSLTRTEDLLNWLDEVVKVLVPEGSLNLLGLSYGGSLACEYALRFPQRVCKLVLLAPAATVLPTSLTMLSRAMLTLIPGADFRKKFYYWLLHDAVRSEETGRAIIDEAIADWEVAERCFGPLPLIIPRVMEEDVLQSLKVPSLFLVGENEKIYSAQKAVSRLSRVAPQIKTEIIPGAGHDLWLSQAGLVNEKVLDFLAMD